MTNSKKSQEMDTVRQKPLTNRIHAAFGHLEITIATFFLYSRHGQAYGTPKNKEEEKCRTIRTAQAIPN